MPIQIATPLGRFVGGSCTSPETHDRETGQLLTDNKGATRVEYWALIAVDKTVTINGQQYANPEWDEYIRKLYAEAKASWPQVFASPGQAALFPFLPADLPAPMARDFSFKIFDGDGADSKGRPHSSKPGHAGCWIIRVSTGYAPQLVKDKKLVNDPNAITPGCFVRAIVDAKTNGSQQTPGLYVNWSGMQYCMWGEPISFGVDALAFFANVPEVPANFTPRGAHVTPPPGAFTPTPVAAPPAAPAAPAAPPPAYQAPTPPAAPAAPGVAPNPSFTAGALAAPPAPPAPPAAPAKPQYVGTEKAQGHSLDAYVAQGWKIDDLIAQGMFVLQQ